MKNIKKAIFPMAGYGTRLFPMTKLLPKEMLPLIDKPLLHYAIEEALRSGIEEFIFIIRKEKNSLQSYLEHSQLISQKNMHYVYQENPLGLGHAIACARDHIRDEFFAVLLPDELIFAQTPCLQQMMDVHTTVKTNVIAIHSVLREEVSQYGIIVGEKTTIPSVFKLKELIEKPSPENAPSSKAIAGRYILSSRIFPYLEIQQPGAKGEIQLTDSLHSLLKKEPFYGLEFEGQRFDCGSKKGYIAATLRLSLEEQDVNREPAQPLKGKGTL